jgi:biotin transport system substrate-specific component
VLLAISFAALTALGTRLKVDLFPVPFTMQVFFILLAGLSLGGRLGALSQLLYLTIGLMGLPVFAGGGGMLYLLGPTGGYLVGFPIAAGLTGWLAEGREDLLGRTLAGAVGVAAIYLCGVSWLGFWLGDPGQAWKAGVLVFVGVDVTKAFLAALLAGKLSPILRTLSEPGWS